MRHIALLALPLMLTACGDAPGGDGEATAPEGPEPLENATLDLGAGGIVIPAQAGFEQLEVPFGSNRAATEATLANVIGGETGQDTVPDCGPNITAVSYEGLTTYFEDEAFVGYAAREPYVPALTRSQMLQDPGVSLVEDSSLGEEFTIGEGEEVLSGMFDGEGDDAGVETLWAGNACVMR
ncbi:hypothetical protein [Aurantiacibacter sediminis]|uniref:Uncharacterized protein n=1 Tax=Aurantiacibacter sediminis TaxID=2793064 RepID=A0ABS0N320_9SPHN|nr:hypothetical protein [Aurantiacibacter sediminis]MBH5322358.1 hypothetical protein [Aurantiacibacter sediminis]